MPSERRMRGPTFALALALAGGLVLTFARAQQLPATPPAAPSTGPATAAPESPTATPPKPEEDVAAPEATPAATPPAKKGDANDPKPATAKGSPQHFEPSEKVRPDFDVAFPVDI